ncbi:MAG: hypothetical protein AAB480_01070 [Patescibacteria group bacterium]
MNDDKEYDDLIKEQFKKLPRVVQEAIVSADVEKHLRELAETHKLHLDQWTALENEVQMTLLGIDDSGELMQNIRDKVHVPEETAKALVQSISEVVFEPIRQELERQLEHPGAVAKATSGVEDMRTRILADASENQPVVVSLQPVEKKSPVPATGYELQATGSVVAATPPAPAPTVKVERAPAAPPSYVSAPSHERKTVEGDPYREQIE